MTANPNPQSPIPNIIKVLNFKYIILYKLDILFNSYYKLYITIIISILIFIISIIILLYFYLIMIIMFKIFNYY